MSRPTETVLLLCVAGLVWALARPAMAAKPARPEELGAVTVTATRTAEPVYDVPASVSVVGAHTIRSDHLGVNLSESVKAVPGLLARNRQNYAQGEQISIRGFGARTTFGVRGVRLYIDGIPASFPDGQGQVSNFNLLSASRIEVLRGPFSALYGNSSGGVIQIFTADGHKPDRLSGGVAYGSYDTVRANVDASGALGKLSYNADFTHFRTGGFRPHSAARRELFNSKLTYHFDSATRLSLVLNGFSGPEAQDPLGLTRAQFESDPRQTTGVASQYNTRKSAEQTRAGLIFKHQFGSGQAMRLMSYYGARQVRQFLPIPVGAQSPPTSSGGVVALNDRFGGGDARWIWHTRLLARPLTLVAGLSLDAEDEHRRGYDNFIGPQLGAQGAVRRDEEDVEQDFGQYLQAEWQVARRWKLTLGARHSRVGFHSHDHYPSNGDGSGAIAYYATTPVAGVLYKAASWVHLYAAYGGGFETPTFAELAYKPDGSSGLNLGLKAARTSNGEIGVKLRPADRTRINLALFHAITRHEIVVDTNHGGRSTYTNAGRVRRQGAELFAEHTFGPRWRVHLAYTYVDATVRTPYLTCTGSPSPCSTPTNTVTAGSRLPGVPESQLDVGLRWGGATGWHAGVDGQYLSDVPVNDNNSASAPAYGLLDTDIGYVRDFGGYRLSVFARVNNLLDTDYVGSVRVNDGRGRFYEPGPGRNFMLGLNLRWK